MPQHCILIIEDQEDIAAMYESILHSAGFKVRKTHSGEEGLAEFKANGGDLVLLDMTLPEIHGTQVLREIRERNATIPVVVITANDDPRIKKQCENLGVKRFLIKPIDVQELLATIYESLQTPAEESELVTLRLPVRIANHLRSIDPNLGNAITTLVEREL